MAGKIICNYSAVTQDMVNQLIPPFIFPPSTLTNFPSPPLIVSTELYNFT